MPAWTAGMRLAPLAMLLVGVGLLMARRGTGGLSAALILLIPTPLTVAWGMNWEAVGLPILLDFPNNGFHFGNGDGGAVIAYRWGSILTMSSAWPRRP